MSADRKLLLLKLMGFLTGEISKSEIYGWALSVAVSSDYEGLINNDKLSEKIMQFLLDVDKPRETAQPIKKIVEYLIACLENKKEFSEEQYKALFFDQSVKGGQNTKLAAAAVEPKLTSVVKPATAQPVSASHRSANIKVQEPAQKLTWISLVARIYIFLFAGVSLIMNLVVIFKPDFLMQPGEVAPVPDKIWRDAFPHLVYALTMMIALIVKGPKILFYGFFFIATWGMFFYWYSITMFIVEHQWPLYYLVMLSPILTIPPTLMFWIMLSRWFNIRSSQ